MCYGYELSAQTPGPTPPVDINPPEVKKKRKRSASPAATQMHYPNQPTMAISPIQPPHQQIAMGQALQDQMRVNALLLAELQQCKSDLAHITGQMQHLMSTNDQLAIKMNAFQQYFQQMHPSITQQPSENNELAMVRRPQTSADAERLTQLLASDHAVVVFDLKGPPYIFSANEKFYQLLGDRQNFEKFLGIINKEGRQKEYMSNPSHPHPHTHTHPPHPHSHHSHDTIPGLEQVGDMGLQGFLEEVPNDSDYNMNYSVNPNSPNLLRSSGFREIDHDELDDIFSDPM